MGAQCATSSNLSPICRKFTYCKIYCVDVVPELSHVRLFTGDCAVRSALKFTTVLPSELIVQVPREDEYQSPAVRGRGQHSVETENT